MARQACLTVGQKNTHVKDIMASMAHGGTEKHAWDSMARQACLTVGQVNTHVKELFVSVRSLTASASI